jgi:hypothetical protein
MSFDIPNTMYPSPSMTEVKNFKEEAANFEGLDPGLWTEISSMEEMEHFGFELVGVV